MNAKQVLQRLEALGDEKVRAQNTKNGAGDNQYGVRMGEIRKIAKELKTNPELGLELWQSGMVEGQLIATLIVKPKQLTTEQLDSMVRQIDYMHVAEWFNNYWAKKHPDKESLREPWMADPHPWAARAGWALTTDRLEKDPDGIDAKAILKRLSKEMKGAHPGTQWAMNFALIMLGIHTPAMRDQAIALGEKLGLYRDYPTSKGCTSPFAPLAIPAMAEKAGK